MTANDTSEIRVWYVAQTKPRQEHIAELNLTRQKYEVLLPLIPKLRHSKTRLIEKDEPLFPGYIFFGQSTLNTRSTQPAQRWAFQDLFGLGSNTPV